MIPEISTRNTESLSRGEKTLSNLLLLFENAVKVPLFRCQRCGECILSSTAFICSQRCPKQLRNGPCGGTDEDGSCEVYPERACVWYRIYYRSQFLKRIDLLYKFNRIHNWCLDKTSSWLNVYRKRIEPPILLTGPDTNALDESINHDA
ncbi:MAG: methylenetetrahydrofolate reductase C-terminal domain-containing protein [Fidelibacterota bacterium]|nr:MAG: methylenetetrahydrofolate reductase C-terminal domain-containing protein [Candidatus Neomarinimicrobiota bacterium]